MNGEIIALASSQILRWIDELNGIYDADARAEEITRKIRQLRREDDSAVNRHEIRRLYSELDSVQFKPDYMCLIIDRDKDYRRACKGFSINGIRYTRLLATSGGVKNSTIVFVSERYAPELRRRIDNGRNMGKQFVPAKLEAYKALVCSASIPVSMPKGIAVVPDRHNIIYEKVIQLHNDMEHEDGEPIMEEIDGYGIDLKFTDGCGMMLPSLAERWSREAGLEYTAGAMNTRLAWEKGMVYAFDFVDFAEKIAGKYEIVDSWGNKVDVRNIELILTESMLKLWDSYKSLDDYLENCRNNGYTFGITKISPERLENERSTNYQFIQSYDLDPDEICELIRPTMNEIRDILGGDWRKTALFLNGVGMSEKSVSRMEDDISKAILIDHNIINDPYVRGYVYQMIKNRIDEAKIGVLKVHGNYSIVGCDFYGFCQSLFGLSMTGLLKAGEIYNKYWSDDGAERLAAFRAPMSCHNSIRLVRPNKSEEASYWFQYIKTSTIFNMWDSAMCAMNGLD